MNERGDNDAARGDAQGGSRDANRQRNEPAAFGAIERLADRLRDLGLWLMRLVS